MSKLAPECHLSHQTLARLGVKTTGLDVGWAIEV